MSQRTLPIDTLPSTLRVEDAVEAATATDIAWIEERLARGTSVLVDCDKELSLYLYLALRQRLRRRPNAPRLVVIDGRARNEAEAAIPRSNLGRMLDQLTEAIRGSVDKAILVLMHLDVLTTTHTGLTAEAREAIPLLYENPEVVLLGFRDPSFEIPKVIHSVFGAQREIVGIPREALPRLITQREARTIHAERFDPYALYKYVSGLNPVRCRRVFDALVLRREAVPGRPPNAAIYQEIRRETAGGDFELPNVDIDRDIAGYDEVKQRLKEELIELVAAKDQLATDQEIEALEDLLPRGIIFHGPPGTGKTYFAKAIATSLDATVIVVSGPELKSKWVGESLPWDEEVFVVLNGRARRMPIGQLVDEHIEGDQVQTWTASDDGRAMLAPVVGFLKHEGPDYIDVLVTQTGREVRVTGGHSLFVQKDGKLMDVVADQIEPGTTRVAVPLRLQAPETVHQLDLMQLLAGRDDVRVQGYDAVLDDAVAQIGASGVTRSTGLSLSRLRAQRRAPLSLGAFQRVALEAGVEIDLSDLSLNCWHRSKSMPRYLPLTEDLGEFLGKWVADGCYAATGVRLANHHNEVDHYAQLCNRLFGHVTRYEKPSSPQGVDLVINSTLLKNVMQDGLEMPDGSSEKRVPAVIFLAPLPVIAAFLRGYFSGDGTFSGKLIEVTTVSRGLAADVMTLLQYFGIAARCRTRTERSGSISYRVRFMWTEFLRRFVEQIGFADESRNQKIRDYLANQGLRRKILTPEAHITNDVLWDLVVGKRRESYARPHVYDLSVPRTERFIAGFGNVLVHNSEENLRRVFRQARQSAPSVIVFDEIDAFASARGTYVGSGVEHSMVNQLLTEMDGFRKNEMVFVVGTTNFLESVDGALLRPGRFEFLIEIPAPDANDREQIARLYDRKYKLGLDDRCIGHIVRRTESLADLEHGLPFTGDHLHALFRALVRQKLRTRQATFDPADIDRALTRKTRREIVLSDDEEKVIAVHEAGHALLAMLVDKATPPERIAIAQDREGALGYVLRAARTRPYALTTSEMRADICVGLGGTVAERMVYGEPSVGAHADLQACVRIARAMVEEYGMDEEVGVHVRLLDRRDSHEPANAERQQKIDASVDKILREEMERATRLLTEHRALHQALVALLLEHKVLHGEQLARFAVQAKG